MVIYFVHISVPVELPYQFCRPYSLGLCVGSIERLLGQQPAPEVILSLAIANNPEPGRHTTVGCWKYGVDVDRKTEEEVARRSAFVPKGAI
jgi:hypothetical protein